MADPWLETRTSLIVRLRHHADAASWEQFVDAYGRIIHSLALRAGLGSEDAEDATWRLGLLDAARDLVRRQLSPRQYQIYDLHVVQEWSVDKVTQTL